MARQSKALSMTGWVLTILVSGFLLVSASGKFMNMPQVQEMMLQHLGWPDDRLLAIGIVEAACVLLFLFPRTVVLGAILLTGYFGGAIATHVRVHDAFIGGVVFGVVAWLALFLRDPRIRAILPITPKLRA